MSNVSRRVRELRKKLGNITQVALGRLVGADQGTVSRWESGKQVPDGPALIKLADLAQQTPREFLGEVEIKPAIAINVQVIGAVQAGAWVEAPEWPPSKQYTVSVLYEPDYKNARRFALEVIGPSMNLEYPEGTVLDCVPIHDVRGPLASGEHVIVERRRADGLREATCKEYVVDREGKTWLWPRSDDPLHQQPLSYQPDSDLGNGVETIEITALVVGYYRKKRRR